MPHARRELAERWAVLHTVNEKYLDVYFDRDAAVASVSKHSVAAIRSAMRFSRTISMFATKTLRFAAMAVILTLLIPLGELAVTLTPSRAAAIDGRHDFDFLFGRWTIRNRRLPHPLMASTEWCEFASASSETPLLGGLANLGEHDAPDAPGTPIHAIAVRLSNTERHQWSINWSSSGTGGFGIATVGSFDGHVGLFYDHEEYNDRPIVVRFTWTQSDDAHCRWEQAFSADDGRGWEPIWVMDFARAK